MKVKDICSCACVSIVYAPGVVVVVVAGDDVPNPAAAR